uniref:Uncharacterized protein n=2 Tax=Babesia bovis TaxID=5865 RepID=A7ARG7_BABBO|eukprot:XP_001610704.1 hypothetical protein [Babesia bovis T2Bo]
MSEGNYNKKNTTFEAYIDKTKMKCMKETIESLRTGDLIFIRYNQEKLNLVSRYKIAAIRALSRGKIYDEVGIVCRNQGMNYVIFLPSCNLNLVNDGMCNIVPDLTNEKSHCVLIDANQLIKQLVPDMVTVKRLICDEAKRKDIVEAMQKLVNAPNLPKRSFFTELIRNWRKGKNKRKLDFAEYRQCLQITKSYDVFNQLYKIQLDENILADNDKPGKGNIYYESKTHKFADNNGSKTKFTNESDDMERIQKPCKDIIEEFQKINKKKQKIDSNYTGASFIIRLYALSGLMLTSGLLNEMEIDELFALNFLPCDAKETIVPRLSQPFQVFDGAHYRSTFENLKRWSNSDVLKSRL